MKGRPKNSSIDRRQFLTATGASLLAAAVPAGAKAAPIGDGFGAPSNPLAGSEAARGQAAAGSLRRIPIGVFDPVYDKLSLDEMLDVVSGLGLEAMEIGTGGYPNNPHCALDD